MMTDEQKKQFCLAISYGGKDDISYENHDCWLSINDVVETQETIEHYFESLGKNINKKGYEIGWNKTPFGDFYRWENVRSQDGSKIKNVYLMNFGSVRAVFHEE